MTYTRIKAPLPSLLSLEGSAVTPAAAAPLVPWKYPGNDLVLGYDAAGRAVILPYQDRAQHLYLPGRTGSGKSRALGSCIRQDIGSHARTGCGFVVFDLHGELVNSVLAVLACDPRARDLPLVVIDFTDPHAVIKWNPLRRDPGVDPAVAARRMGEAVTHAQGGLAMAQTQTLQRTMTTAFHAAIEDGLTIPELLTFADPEAASFRAEIAGRIDDERTRADLERMNRLSKARLEEELLAFQNRISGLNATARMRAMFDADGEGFSFRWAIETGAIVLVNLATSGGTITETDARVLASLMLTELWQAAQSLGKGAAGERRPFYVYIDEAPFIATPTIALQLAQARGFGLHFTIAAQATSQFEDFGGEHGSAIRKAVLRDTLTKVLMAQTAEEDDIRPLARELALAYYNPLLRKHTTTTYQTVGEEKEEYWTISRGMGLGMSEGATESEGHSRQRSTGTSWSYTTTTGNGSGFTATRSTSDGVVTPEVLAAETHPGHTSHEESEGESTSEQSFTNESDGVGGSELDAVGRNNTRGTSRQQSLTATETDQQHFRWKPVIVPVENPQFLSFDEQLTLWEQKLFMLHKRHALLSRQGALATEIRTPTVRDPAYVDPAWIEELLAHMREKFGFWQSMTDVNAKHAERRGSDAGGPTRLTSYGRRTQNSLNPPSGEGQ